MNIPLKTQRRNIYAVKRHGLCQDWSRDDVKDHFEVSRLEDGRAERILEACRDAGLIMVVSRNLCFYPFNPSILTQVGFNFIRKKD